MSRQTKALRCCGCNANLDCEEGNPTIRCNFCGTVNHIPTDFFHQQVPPQGGWVGSFGNQQGHMGHQNHMQGHGGQPMMLNQSTHMGGGHHGHNDPHWPRQRCAPPWIGIIFIVFGSFALLFGIIAMISEMSMSNWDSISAEVVSIDDFREDWDDGRITRTYFYHVRYTVDGQEFTMPMSSTDTNRRVGQIITIRVNPNNPMEIAGPGGFAGPIIILVIGIVITAAGIITYITLRRKKSALQNGHAAIQ